MANSDSEAWSLTKEQHPQEHSRAAWWTRARKFDLVIDHETVLFAFDASADLDVS